MKSFHHVLICLLAVFFLTCPVLAAEPSVIVADCSVTPEILMPGDKGMVTVTLLNTVKGAAVYQTSMHTTSLDKTVSTTSDLNPVIESVYLDGKRDIKVLGGNSQFEGEIGSGQSIKISFLIQAPELAGVYFPLLLVRIKGGESLKYPVPVNVNTPVSTLKKPALILEQVPLEFVEPGDDYNTGFSVTNKGESTADEITIRITDKDSSIAPKATGAFHIEKLISDEKAEFDLSLQTDRNADLGIHEIPLEIEYTIIDGTKVTQSESLNVDMRGRSELAITSVETDPSRISKGDPFDLIIRLENTGTGDAKSTKAHIDLPLSGSKDAYVGKIKTGNDAPAVYVLEASEAGEFDYLFSMVYEDDWGEHSSEQTLHLSISKSEDDYVWVIFIIIVLAVLCYLGYRYMKSEKEKTK